MDTVGLMDTKATKDIVAKNLIAASLGMGTGPHILIYTVKMNSRYTQEDSKVLTDVLKLLGDGIKQHLIVAFTHCESLAPGETLEKRIKEGRVILNNYN